MVLIIGGAYQGKLDYALDRYGLSEGDVCRCETGGTPRGKIIYEIDKWIYRLAEAGADVEEAIRELINVNSDAVVICNDISCGVVPVDAVQRKWREAVSRAAVQLAGASDEVVRLFCGIPTRIK